MAFRDLHKSIPTLPPQYNPQLNLLQPNELFPSPQLPTLSHLPAAHTVFSTC